MMTEQDTPSGFLLRNLIKGLLWFAVIITAYIMIEGYLEETLSHEINHLANKKVLLFSIFTVSEIVFGIIPPEFFMILWQHQGDLLAYIINLSVLTVISYGAGVLGYYIGITFTKSHLFRKIYSKYLMQYEYSLQKYGMYLVLVGAITPVPFSAMCMLAGSVQLPFKRFLLMCLFRVFRFAAYGWMVWSFPNWFD
ncbi:MAG: VTT domain-containing protein [Cyclobacteriaceae bacterium]|jgi:membrane protein YqaA with SNARE-associated domain|nr:VTT domain-containing protein [Cyclobacteriaceae bacterium]